MAAEHSDGFEELSPEEAAMLRDADKAERYQTMRDRGRQIGGVPGAIMAGLMVALRDIYEAPRRGNGDVVVDAASSPLDVDRDGMDLSADDVGGRDGVTVAPLERRAPIVPGRRRRRQRQQLR